MFRLSSIIFASTVLLGVMLAEVTTSYVWDGYPQRSSCSDRNCTTYSSYRNKDCECLQVFTFRFGPGTELKSSIESIVRTMNMQAASIVTCVGTVNDVTLSFVRQSQSKTTRTRTYRRNFNLNSLSGTVGPNYSNLYVVLSEGNGHTKSGQLVSAYVLTTVEVVLLENYQECFSRDSDGGLAIGLRIGAGVKINL